MQRGYDVKEMRKDPEILAINEFRPDEGIRVCSTTFQFKHRLMFIFGELSYEHKYLPKEECLL